MIMLPSGVFNKSRFKLIGMESPRILIADDAFFVREILQQIFLSQGWQVVALAENGIEAVQLSEKQKPNVIIMDLVMPEKNGIDATREIKKHSPNVAIIACTTMGQEDMILKAIEAGCAHYIIKPFEHEQVVGAVKKVLGM